MDTVLDKKSLEVSIPVKLLKSSMFDTPPATPFNKQPPLTPLSSFASCTPKTPRKALHPMRTVPPNNNGNAAIVSFKMCKFPKASKTEAASSISLKISYTFDNWRHIRPSKARRILFFDDEDSKKHHLQDGKQRKSKPKRISSSHRRHTVSFTKPPFLTTPLNKDSSYEFIEDADDEMDRIDLLSPPSTPTTKCAPHEETPLPYKALKFSGSKKTCLSCHTTKTPLWRDSEDGTPYCNACGIRYRKYRIRCSACLSVPHKDELVSSTICNLCGNQFISTKHKFYSR